MATTQEHLHQIVSKTVETTQVSRTGKYIVLTFTDGTEIEFNTQNFGHDNILVSAHYSET